MPPYPVLRTLYPCLLLLAAGVAIGLGDPPLPVLPACNPMTLTGVTLAAVPSNGTHLLQLRNPKGALGNELPFCVGAVAGCL